MTQTYAFFDTETTDMINFKAPNSDPSQPTIIQLAGMLTDSTGNHIHSMSCVLNSLGCPMSVKAEEVHGISKPLADTYGIPPGSAISLLFKIFSKASVIVGHNIKFDLRMLKIAGRKTTPQIIKDLDNLLLSRPTYCTMFETTKICQLPKAKGNGYKWPKLEELYYFLFNNEMPDGHDAMVDVEATAKCFFELKKRGLLPEGI